MAAMSQLTVFPQKNTFIHFEEPDSPASSGLDANNSAPGTLLQKSFRMRQELPEEAGALEQPANGLRRSILRRMFGLQKEVAAEVPAQAEPASPVKIEVKNTFVHFEEGSMPAVPPVFSAPGTSVFLAALTPAESSQSRTVSVRTGVAQGPASTFGGSAAEDAAQRSEVAPCQRAGTASLGSEGHCTGQCVPCLMQVRWQAGKCVEPCKFGALCGRCHEAHTEQELQKIQARMRKQKKKHGQQAAAMLSSAYVKGKAAPVGAGAAAVHRAS